MNDFFDLQEIDFESQPIENPISECYGCEANMCDYGSRTPYCTLDQYNYKAGNWKPPNEKQITEFINNQRFIKLNEILNEKI